MKACWIILLSFLSVAPVFAETDQSQWCGTRGLLRTEYYLKLHEKHEREIKALASPAPVSRNADIGDIAVIEGSSKTLISPNNFDLVGKKLTFTPAGGGYDVKIANGSVSATQGDRVPLKDDSSKKIKFASNFVFPFYGQTYDAIFINSDGNLTFKSKDDSSSSRDAFRVLIGPPRLAPFFTDLNPGKSGEVRILSTAKKVRVTWNSVPEFGATNSNTFQVNLYKNGKIEFIYGSIEGKEAITGISPGKNTNFKLVDFSQPQNDAKGPILERFATKFGVDFVGLLQEFTKTHSQGYDFIVIFTDFDIDLENAFAFFSPIRNDVTGLGLPLFDLSNFFGDPQYQGFLMMGFIENYPDNPQETFLGSNNTIDVMGQENGHRWLAFPTAIIEGKRSSELLGRQLAHWNFYMDTDASEMEGNDIRDNGNGTFTTIASTSRYSNLDLYMMGFLPPSKVKPTFFVRADANRGRAPQEGFTFSGTRVNVTLNDIIQAEGEREPSSADSQKIFKEAFVYLTQPGTNPSNERISHVETIRSQWVNFFRTKTKRKGKLDTNLK
jgi:hypothetical protein